MKRFLLVAIIGVCTFSLYGCSSLTQTLDDDVKTAAATKFHKNNPLYIPPNDTKEAAVEVAEEEEVVLTPLPEIDPLWPTSEVARKIPPYFGGIVLSVIEEPSTASVLIGEVSEEQARDYWESAQEAGYTTIVSESNHTRGFTYVATNNMNNSLTTTWNATENVLTLLVIAV